MSPVVATNPADPRSLAAIHFAPSLTRRQTLAWHALHDDSVSEVLYGGAKGGGKSVFGCFWVFLKALEVIREYDLKPTSFPIPVAFMGRKQGVDFTNTTLETWKRFIPVGAYRIKEQAKEIIIGDAVKIDFGGMDKQEAVQKFNSAEYAFFFLDQAEEVTRDDIAVLRASLRLVINGRQCKAKALLTANPARCWLRDEFITSPRDDQRYIQALPSDNPYLDDSYLEILRQSFKHRPELLAAYLEGSWDSFEGMDQIIRDLWLREAMDRKRYPAEPQSLVVCDPARFGDDETVIYDMKDTQIAKETIYGKKDTMYTANVLFTKQRDSGGCPVVVDTIGIGAGIGDRLVEMGCKVISINASKKASDVKRYYNLRAEMWTTGGERFAEGDVALSHNDPVLRGQLCTPTYKFRNGRILIESKDDIKKRLGRSPDRADTYIMGLYALALLVRHRASEGLRMMYPKPAPTDRPPATSYQARVDQRAEDERRRSQW